jgi:cellulose synthase/poly-beta-1,6-N-acetylglucosamine synthase-like glycosyltransferase
VAAAEDKHVEHVMSNFVTMPGSIEYITRPEPQHLTAVELGYQTLLERAVTIVRLTPHVAASPRLRQRFIQEVRSLASLHHPNVVQVYESGLDDDIPYVILEHLSGITLQHRLDQLIDQDEHMDLEEVASIVHPIADAVKHAHERAMLVYDLSPTNIVLTADDRVMLAGLGQPLPENILATPPTMLAYAAPERLIGGSVSFRSDIYGLGVLLYHLLCGRLPFEGSSLGIIAKKQNYKTLPSIGSFRPDLAYPEALDLLLQQALARQASKRMISADAFRASFAEAIEAQQARAQHRLHKGYAASQRVQLRRRQQAASAEITQRPAPVAEAPAAAAPHVVADKRAEVVPTEMALEVGGASASWAFMPLPEVALRPPRSAPPEPAAPAKHPAPAPAAAAAAAATVAEAQPAPATPLEIAPDVAIATPARAIVPLPEVAPLPAKDSAQQVLTSGQKVFAVLLLVALAGGLIFNWLVTVQIVIGAVCIFYLASTVYKLQLIHTSLRHRVEFSPTPEEVAALHDDQLPIYTILVPLYKEAAVLPNLVHSMAALDYPADRLDIKLLLEEDDDETIDAAHAINLPSSFEVVVVPQGRPKGKPRACNYGLKSARGEYLVIYDAEDQVDATQLKQVLIAFEALGPRTVCVQAKLNYYNQSQNLLTRLFTAEYSMWFDLFLPGLQALRVPIPLGGTSNHFRMDVLRNLGGWDAWNVTEDADLGLRLYKRGYLTGVVDSTTYEEANSQVHNWIRQRSRWFKGYMQTWLVHMRNPVRLWGELGARGFLGFQMMVFGAFFTVLVNPIFWILTLLWALTQWNIIEAIFVGPAFYLGGLCLYLGNFALIYMTMAACLNRGYNQLVKTMLLAPVYWMLMSWACWKGFLQLFTNPFYWEKTIHGLYKGTPHGGPTTQQS